MFSITEGSLGTGTTKVLHTLQHDLILSYMQTEDGNHVGIHHESNLMHIRNVYSATQPMK